MLRSANYDEAAGTGWIIRYDGDAFFQGVKINANEITIHGAAPLPIGFVYFQLPGKPTPQVLFKGIWKDITSDYAGYFFRAEGGNAAPFGQSQGMSIQSHSHPFEAVQGWGYEAAGAAPSVLASMSLGKESKNTSSTGGTETRPVNMTIKIWEKVSHT